MLQGPPPPPHFKDFHLHYIVDTSRIPSATAPVVIARSTPTCARMVDQRSHKELEEFVQQKLHLHSIHTKSCALNSVCRTVQSCNNLGSLLLWCIQTDPPFLKKKTRNIKEQEKTRYLSMILYKMISLKETYQMAVHRALRGRVAVKPTKLQMLLWSQVLGSKEGFLAQVPNRCTKSNKNTTHPDASLPASSHPDASLLASAHPNASLPASTHPDASLPASDIPVPPLPPTLETLNRTQPAAEDDGGDANAQSDCHGHNHMVNEDGSYLQEDTTTMDDCDNQMTHEGASMPRNRGTNMGHGL